jgi:Ca2+-binding EF-hand superfamily protein
MTDIPNTAITSLFTGNGIIDFDEFIKMMIHRNNSEESEETLREAFKVFDHDKNNLCFF